MEPLDSGRDLGREGREFAATQGPLEFLKAPGLQGPGSSHET